jgi:hypothetical protein
MGEVRLRHLHQILCLQVLPTVVEVVHQYLQPLLEQGELLLQLKGNRLKL